MNLAGFNSISKITKTNKKASKRNTALPRRAVGNDKCKCIRNWPLPIGAFQDQYKQIVINKHNLVKNPNWREADQSAIYKRRREVELGATENNIS